MRFHYIIITTVLLVFKTGLAVPVADPFPSPQDGGSLLDSSLMEQDPNNAELAAAAEAPEQQGEFRCNYISYGVLKRNSVPCSRRGASYYNCRAGAQANPYDRGCSGITRCRAAEVMRALSCPAGATASFYNYATNTEETA